MKQKRISESPYHRRLRRIGSELTDLLVEKNKAYGSSFSRSGEILRILYPNGVRPEQYQDMLGVVRVLDKLMRIAHRKNAFGENPWFDLGGYGILGAVGANTKK